MSSRTVDDALLRSWLLPEPADHHGKDDRGSVLIISGSGEMPGAASLAATAALRAGAGKLCIATTESAAMACAITVPEARVISLPETARGGFRIEGIRRLPEHFDAVLFGSGVLDEDAAIDFVEALSEKHPSVPLLLDAVAMGAVPARRARHPVRLVLTPHAREFAYLCGKEGMDAEAPSAGADAARRWGITLALKGAVTNIFDAEGAHWRHVGGNPGLGVSGSGDVLAGLMTGLLARGATAAQAATWAVALHAKAGDALAGRIGSLGYLPRELAAEVPRLMAAITH